MSEHSTEFDASACPKCGGSMTEHEGFPYCATCVIPPGVSPNDDKPRMSPSDDTRVTPPTSDGGRP